MKLRQATIDDCLTYFEWANDAEVRANSFSTNPIGLNVHIDWFKNKIEANDQLWVLTKSVSDTKHFSETGCECECHQTPVGQIRLQKHDLYTEIHYSIAKEHRGQGNGTIIIKEAMKHITKWPVIAQVKQSNKASRIIFDKLGFNIIATTIETITYQKTQP